MSAMIVTAVLVLVIGSLIAVGWWSIADKVFPSSRRSSSGGGQASGPAPRVVRGFPTSGESSSTESNESGPTA